MKIFIICGLLIFGFCEIANSQISQVGNESPIIYVSSFHRFTNDEINADSAFYCIKRLASNKRFEIILKELMHNSFAELFLKSNPVDVNDTTVINILNKKKVLGNEILYKIETDTTALLKEVAEPIIIWNKIQENPKDISLMKVLTNDFLLQCLTPSKFYTNRTGRYGLMIYKIINELPELKPEALKIFNTVKKNLIINQKDIAGLKTPSEFQKRAWYRYLFAYVSDYESSITIDTIQKQVLLKTAFDFSPDFFDKNYLSAYYYDMIYLSGKESFKEGYITYLIQNTSDKSQVLQVLLKLALGEPDNKQRLQDFYTDNIHTNKKFSSFWTESIENIAESFSGFLVTQTDKKLFSTKELYGKWVLIDFWGTWCIPCREEHPELQKFYNSIVQQNLSKIALLTVACFDTEEKVVEYMNKMEYNFPVSISDGKIEAKFKVQGYPTKILVTPKGKYITVPYNIDWTDFVIKYCDL